LPVATVAQLQEEAGDLARATSMAYARHCVPRVRERSESLRGAELLFRDLSYRLLERQTGLFDI